LNWQDAVEKFDRLVAGRIDEALCQQLKEVVCALEGLQVKDLMELLSRVQVML
jgi:2-methylcitrate dehydratase